jgi:hypothetical protein
MRTTPALDVVEFSDGDRCPSTAAENDGRPPGPTHKRSSLSVRGCLRRLRRTCRYAQPPNRCQVRAVLVHHGTVGSRVGRAVVRGGGDGVLADPPAGLDPGPFGQTTRGGRIAADRSDQVRWVERLPAPPARLNQTSTTGRPPAGRSRDPSVADGRAAWTNQFLFAKAAAARRRSGRRRPQRDCCRPRQPAASGAPARDGRPGTCLGRVPPKSGSALAPHPDEASGGQGGVTFMPLSTAAEN